MMGQTTPAPNQRLIEYAVDRVLDETNTDTKILVLARQDGQADSFPIWIGAASYDERVGLSHTTGQITHHISGDVDKERDHLFDDLKKTGDLADAYTVAGFHKELKGVNGGGDYWHTDGDLDVGVVRDELP